jgi:hypothetical protein
MEQVQIQHPPARLVESRGAASARMEAMRRILPRDPCAVVAGVQAAYYLGIGLWPIVHCRSFAKVTGPKPEAWLAKAVGACFVNIGLTLGSAALSEGRSRRKAVSREMRSLGVRSALQFAAFDFWYGGIRRRISPVYMVNGIAQLALAGAWFVAIGMHRHERHLPPRAAAFA